MKWHSLLVILILALAAPSHAERRKVKRRTTVKRGTASEASSSASPLDRSERLIKPIPLAKDDEKMLKDTEKLLIRRREKVERWSLPGSTFSTPVGFGADWGIFYLGSSFQNRNYNGTKANGTHYVGLGLFDSFRYLGAEVTLISYDTDHPLSTGGVSVKVHRVLPWSMGISVGMENILEWGGQDNGQSTYVALSKVFGFSEFDDDMFSSLTVHVGAGNGRFNTIENIIARSEQINWFAAAAVRVFAPLQLIINYDGNNLIGGASVTPFRRVPLILSAGVQELNGGIQSTPRFIFTISYGDSFRSGK